MITDNTERSKALAIEYAGTGYLPESLNEKNSNWIYAIALLERSNLEEDYVIVKNDGFSANIEQVFSPIMKQIRKIKEIYPYLLYSTELHNDLKTMGQAEKFLLKYYDRSKFCDSEGNLDSELMKKYVNQRRIVETLANNASGVFYSVANNADNDLIDDTNSVEEQEEKLDEEAIQLFKKDNVEQNNVENGEQQESTDGSERPTEEKPKRRGRPKKSDNKDKEPASNKQ